MSTNELLKDALGVVKETVEADGEPETVDVDGIEHVPARDDDGDDDPDADDYGWDDGDMEESQTDRDVNHDEVDESYAEVDGETPDPENDDGSGGNPNTGTKSVTDALTGDDLDEIDELEIGHLEINEYYRVWIDDPQQAPPEVEVQPADEAAAEPPTSSATHYYDAPFEASVAAVGFEEAAEKLAKWKPDPEFPTKRDLEAAELAQVDLFVANAALTRSVEKVTPSALELVKSPLALFYALKALGDGHGQTKRNIRGELDRRGVEGVDKLRRADPVRAPDRYDLNKRKVYVQSEEDVPDEYKVEYGPNGGMFYRPDGSPEEGDDEAEKFEDDLRDAVEDTDKDPVDEIPSSLWRDYAGQIEDEDLLFDALEPIQDHGAKFSKDRVRQRLRGMGYEPEEIDDRITDHDGPFTGDEHDEFDTDYTDQVVDRGPLLGHEDAKTGASASAMEVEVLDDGTEVFVTNYGDDDIGSDPAGIGVEGQDPEYRERQMATYESLRALTAEENVPPHVHVPMDERPEGAAQDADAVAVMEFDGEEAWEAPESWKDNVEYDDYVEQTAKNFLCGNNDLHGDNVMLNADGDLAFHDLDHSAGRLDQDDPINAGNVAHGAITHIENTGGVLGLVDDHDVFEEEVFEQAKELAEERGDAVRELLEQTDDPFRAEYLENIAHNIELVEEADGLDEIREVFL